MNLEMKTTHEFIRCFISNVEGKGLAATHPKNEKTHANHKTQWKLLTASPA
jgi:hypothetical protein